MHGSRESSIAHSDSIGLHLRFDALASSDSAIFAITIAAHLSLHSIFTSPSDCARSTDLPGRRVLAGRPGGIAPVAHPGRSPDRAQPHPSTAAEPSKPLHHLLREAVSCHSGCTAGLRKPTAARCADGKDASRAQDVLLQLKQLHSWLSYKKLDGGRFRWPQRDSTIKKMVLTHEELALLLGGIDLTQTRPRKWYRKTVDNEPTESLKTA
jgi:IS66 Orf2 like protein